MDNRIYDAMTAVSGSFQAAMEQSPEVIQAQGIHGWPVWIFYINYAAAFAWFLGWELLAVYRAEKGDTFSEIIFAFLRGGPARYLLLGGVFAWLIVHFFWHGKHG